MTTLKNDEEPQKRRRAPAKTAEAREKQLISLAIDLAEQQILNGTASSQVITHFLKLGSTTEQLSKKKLEKENELLGAKTDSIKSAATVAELYSNAIKVMRRYSGNADFEDSDDTDL